MSAIQDETIADLQRANAELRRERDAALLEKAALAKELAERKTDFDERIEHQAATIDVLKAMSASPGDPQPVFELIVRLATERCNGIGTALREYDGQLIHHRAYHGPIPQDSELSTNFLAMFPMRPSRQTFSGRAILEKRVVHVTDIDTETELDPRVKAATPPSTVAVPLMRDDVIIGVITLSGERGGFSDNQIELLKIFAEQAVIAISSAETYRALQTRTSDLQESLEYQTATSDVLKVISRSTFDLQPVLDTVAETAAKLCDADQAAIYQREGGLVRLVANCGFPSEYEALVRGLGAFPLDLYPQKNVVPRAIREGRTVHIDDVAVLPGYGEGAIKLGKQRTSLGVPLLREGEVIGAIVLARQRVEPFIDRQTELVSTFADQAVIAIENTRLLTETREALEQQTATAELLQAINSSPGDPAPVFDAMLDKALRLCSAAFGALRTVDGDALHQVASRNLPPRYAEYWSSPVRLGPTNSVLGTAVFEQRTIQIEDMAAAESYHAGSSIAVAGVELGGVRTLVHVPLIKDNITLGVLTAFRQEVRLSPTRSFGCWKTSRPRR
jgi:two-component system, NtrC family, sensor kinase